MRNRFVLFSLLMIIILSGCGININVQLVKPQQVKTKPLQVENMPDSETIPITEKEELKEVSVKEQVTVKENRPDTQNLAPSAIPVLYYHSIAVEKGNELRIPPEQFEVQMNYLHSNGYETISLEQFFNYMNGSSNANSKLPVKPILITFDDGYKDNYSNAFPILKKYGFKATVFMVSNYVDGTGFLSKEEIKELIANGWDIQGHTANHPDLTKIDSSLLPLEIFEAKRSLETITGKEVKYFAYPYGKYNSEVITRLKASGYKMAFSTERGWATPGTENMLVKRVYCYTDMGLSEFINRVTNRKY